MSTGLSEASRRVLQHWPVRKTRKQKEAFRTDLCSELYALGWKTQVETNRGPMKCNNVVAGDVSSAKLVLTAHYDTPARLFMPNVVFPRCLPLMLLYQILLVVPMMAAIFAASWALAAVGLSRMIPLAALAVALGYCWLIMAGPANPSNVNDNTSGVLTLLEVAAALPLAERHKVALVFFDNEELGLLGSMAFRKRHGDMAQKLLINFDCVGDGDTLLLMGRRLKEEKQRDVFEACFAAKGDKRVRLDASAFTFYPSDQANFKGAFCAAAFHDRPVVGLVLGRIHTRRDTRLDPQNLEILRGGCVRLAERL